MCYIKVFVSGLCYSFKYSEFPSILNFSNPRMFAGLIAAPIGRGVIFVSRGCIRNPSILARGRSTAHPWCADRPCLPRRLLMCGGVKRWGERVVQKRFSSLPQNGPGSEVDRVEPWTKSCGCCGMHTQGKFEEGNLHRLHRHHRWTPVMTVLYIVYIVRGYTLSI